MSNRAYLCRGCGELRRAPAVYRKRGQTAEEARASTAWPKHCGGPMEQLTDEQGVAATRIEAEQRVRWAASGLHILKRGGKRKWEPALNERRIEAAKQELSAFLKRETGSS